MITPKRTRTGKISVMLPVALEGVFLRIFKDAKATSILGRYELTSCAVVLEKLDMFARLAEGAEGLAIEFEETLEALQQLDQVQASIEDLRGESPSAPAPKPAGVRCRIQPPDSFGVGCEPRSEFSAVDLQHLQLALDNLKEWLQGQLVLLPDRADIEAQLALARNERDRLVELRYRRFNLHKALRQILGERRIAMTYPGAHRAPAELGNHPPLQVAL